MAHKLAERLCLDPKERTVFLNNFSGRLDYEALSVDQFKVISDWYHFAILSLIETKDFRNGRRWIAKRFGIRIDEVKKALNRLIRLGLIREDENGKLLPHAPRYMTSDEVRDLSVRKSHALNLDLARKSLETDDIDQRDFSALTMAINPKKMKEAKEKIRRFLDEMSLLLETDPKTEVYKLCIQLIPLTKGGERK